MFKIIVLVVSAHFGTSATEIFATKPTNVAVIVGSRMRMQCKAFAASASIQWNYYNSTDKTKPTFLYNGEKVSNQTLFADVTIDKSVKNCRDLEISKTKFENAGIYECVILVPDSTTRVKSVSSSAELVVLASDPLCHTNISESSNTAREWDIIYMQCHLNYIGSWSPLFQWSIHKASVESTNASESSNISASGIKQFTSSVTNQVDANYNGAIFYCKVNFTQFNNQTAPHAQNVPEYEFQWKFTLQVEYGPRNVVITPRQDEYNLGDVIECKADANPAPNYRWEAVKSSGKTDGAQLTLVEANNQSDASQIYKCTAENLVRGETKTATAEISVKIRPKGTEVSLWSVVDVCIFIALGIVFGIIVSVITFLLQRVWRKKLCTSKDELPGIRVSSKAYAALHQGSVSRISPVASHIPESIEVDPTTTDQSSEYEVIEYNQESEAQIPAPIYHNITPEN